MFSDVLCLLVWHSWNNHWLTEENTAGIGLDSPTERIPEAFGYLRAEEHLQSTEHEVDILVHIDCADNVRTMWAVFKMAMSGCRWWHHCKHVPWHVTVPKDSTGCVSIFCGSLVRTESFTPTHDVWMTSTVCHYILQYIYIYITIITLYIKERCICRFFTSGRTRFLIGVPGYLNLEPSTGKPCRRWLQVSLWSPCGWKPVFFIWYISMILYVSY